RAERQRAVPRLVDGRRGGRRRGDVFANEHLAGPHAATRRWVERARHDGHGAVHVPGEEVGRLVRVHVSGVAERGSNRSTAGARGSRSSWRAFATPCGRSAAAVTAPRWMSSPLQARQGAASLVRRSGLPPRTIRTPGGSWAL